MLNLQRPAYLFFLAEDTDSFDLQAFLRGEMKVERRTMFWVLSILSESRVPLSAPELSFVLALPEGRWAPFEQMPIPEKNLTRLIAKGVVLSDADEESAHQMREAHQRLLDNQWHPYAALFHFMSREGDDKIAESDTEVIALSLAQHVGQHIEKYGSPLPAFDDRGAEGPAIDLPLDSEEDTALRSLLRSRKTVRAFDSSRPLPLESLSTLLRLTYGCHGMLDLGELQLLRKASPSGGSLHPIEAFCLVNHVEGVEPGLYHYEISSHRLRLLRSLEREAARELSIAFCRNQKFSGGANVLMVMVARVLRNFWKYRQQGRAYSVIHMDCAHLSQTFYLLAAELGLGAFFTGALDTRRIERELGLKAQEEIPVGVNGCGFLRPDGEELGLTFAPFTPRR